MTSNTDKKSLKDKIKQSRVHAKIKEFVLTTATLMAVCAGASAQTKEKQEKDDKEGVKTEVNVGFSNISALEVQKDKAVFYNDFFPTVNAGIEKDGLYANMTAGVLVIFSGSDWTAINNKLLFELGKHFGEDVQLSVKAGRTPMEAPNVFFNGVGKVDYYTDSKGVGTFGDGQQGLLLCAKYKGHEVNLGFSNKLNEGFYFLPNLKDPEMRAFYAKVIESFEKDGFKVSLSAATRLGQNTHKAFASASLKKDNFGVAVGGNYDFDSKVMNAYVRGAYTSLNSGLTYVLQGLKTGDTYSVHAAAGKNGVQGFVAVENITPSQNKAPEFTSTPTVNFGVSYS
ncbi:MAG: hypothetical protein SPL76_06060, partial [Cyanobacteriota bacterium]|nr:hypothetical protein [Cyanobacteriota bacterium]